MSTFVRCWRLGIFFVLLLGSASAASADEPLIIVGDQHYVPLEYRYQGEPQGLNVELVRAIFAAMNRPITLRLMPWNKAQTQVLSGQADALSLMSSTPQRQQSYDFSEPTLELEFSLFVRAGAASIYGLHSLGGKRVGVTSGGFPRQFLSARGLANLVIIPNYHEGFALLRDRRIDAVAADTWVGAYTIEQLGIQNVVIVGQPFAKRSAALAVKKGNSALLQVINEGIARVRADGTLERILNRWTPKTMIFVSRGRMSRILVWGLIGLGLVAAGAIVLWIRLLRRQVREQTRQLQRAHDDLEQRVERRTTELNRANGALRTSEARYRSLIEGSLQGIVLLNASGACVFANQAMADIFGYAQARDLLGQPLPERIVTQHRMRVLRDRQAHGRDASAPQYYELQCRRQDGTLCWVETMVSVLEVDGEPITMATAVDITERKALEQEILTLSEHEQRRLGQELHDSLGQLLTGTALFSKLLADKLATQELPEAAEAAQVADWIQQAVGTTHDVAHGLYPESLTSHGLTVALEALVAQTAQLFGITCRLHGSIPEDLLPLNAALHLYRIAQEALTNAVKHGQATSIVIQLEADSASLCLRVQDNGTGMSQEETPGGMGLRNMQTRAALLDAALSIDSTAADGTRVVCHVPLPTPIQI